MNTTEPIRVVVTVAMAIALAFVGLHTALTASNWFAGYVVLPLLKGQDNLRAYMLLGVYVAYVAAALAVGVALSYALSYARAVGVWLGIVAFVLAVGLFAIDWEQRGGSYFWALFDLPIVVFLLSSLFSVYLTGRLWRPHAAQLVVGAPKLFERGSDRR
jgi:hypothetical protein